MLIAKKNHLGKVVAGVVVLAVMVAVFTEFTSTTNVSRVSFPDKLQAHCDAEKICRDMLAQHVDNFALRIGERSMQVYSNLHQAAGYIEDEFRDMGYSPHAETYTVQGKTVRNIIVEKPGSMISNEIILIGAHYDSLPGTTGADDNASGVAALLELARIFVAYDSTRTLRFVAFVNEEPPYFQTWQMGSMVNAKRAKARGDQIVAMLSLESIGAYYDHPGSQNYPPGYESIYPDRGNFIAFIANRFSEQLLTKTIGAFRREAEVPSEMLIAEPGIVEGGGSDHWSFWKHGYPAVMVTDTAPFRYPHYHKADDTPDKLDFDRMTGVVRGLAAMIRLLDRDASLSEES